MWGLDGAPSGIAQLDKFLHGGFNLGQCIEICGLPGSGKTTFCMQMALQYLYMTQDNTVVWIDTRGDFAPRRISQMADDDVELLDRIILITALTVELLEEAIRYIKMELLSSHSIPLVIVDNISIPFRILSIDDIGSRIAVIRKIGLALRELLLQPLTLLVVNHMTTRFIDEETSRLVPALGENWAVMTDLRLLFEERSSTRAMVILRSDLDDFEQKELLFCITSKGVDFSLR